MANLMKDQFQLNLKRLRNNSGERHRKHLGQESIVLLAKKRLRGGDRLNPVVARQNGTE
jgi:hypothetical protein